MKSQNNLSVLQAFDLLVENGHEGLADCLDANHAENEQWTVDTSLSAPPGQQSESSFLLCEGLQDITVTVRNNGVPHYWWAETNTGKVYGGDIYLESLGGTWYVAGDDNLCWTLDGNPYLPVVQRQKIEQDARTIVALKSEGYGWPVEDLVAKADMFIRKVYADDSWEVRECAAAAAAKWAAGVVAAAGGE